MERRRTATLTLFIVSLVLLIAAPLGVMLPTWANQPGAPDPLTLPMHPAVANIWRQTDGQIVDGGAQRAWLWGPSAVAMTVEHYAGSPSGQRRTVYFEKGRLDILDPNAAPDSPWFATGGLLVSELISGQVQFGDSEFVQRSPAQIAIAGDLDQPNPVTYASLALLQDAGLSESMAEEFFASSLDDSLGRSRVQPRAGATITALLLPDGSVLPGGQPDSQVIVGGWDDITGHNIAAPFAAWDAAQPFPATWLLGHPLTEPYWIDTTVLGTPKRILVQAFQRRVLTWTPDNPPAWQVESTNAGTHYRAWRGLSQPGDMSLTGLASLEPSGEEIVAAASANGVDPYLLTAIARVVSGGDPLAVTANGGQGLMGVQALQGGSTLDDPFANAIAAAQALATIAAGNADPRAQLAAYFRPENPDLNDPNLAGLVDTTLAARDQLRAQYAPQAPADAGAVNPLAKSGAALAWSGAFNSDWWDHSLAWFGGWGGALAGWQLDPHGYYCAHPDYAPGGRLRLVANNVTIDCTIGALVPNERRAGWADQWTVELNASAFAALHLDGNNSVNVVHLSTGDANTSGAGVWISAGQAAYYSPTYDTPWWEWAMTYYNAKGVITPGWNFDPNGYYCVHTNYLPGDRLRLVANGVTLDCTVGDMVADQDVWNWRQHFAVELAWNTFKALGLDRYNHVEVYYLGPAPKPERYGSPPDDTTAPPASNSDPEPTATPEPPPPDPPAATPTPDEEPPAPTVEPTQTPEPPAPTVEPTQTPEPPAATAEPTEPPAPTEIATVEPTPPDEPAPEVTPTELSR